MFYTVYQKVLIPTSIITNIATIIIFNFPISIYGFASLLLDVFTIISFLVQKNKVMSEKNISLEFHVSTISNIIRMISAINPLRLDYLLIFSTILILFIAVSYFGHSEVIKNAKAMVINLSNLIIS